MSNEATDTPDISWLELGDIANFPAGEITSGERPDQSSLAIYNVDGDFYASLDRCTHGKASFCDEGELEGKVVECGWHFGSFDVTTGDALTLPCRTPLITFATKVENNKLFVSTKPNKRTRPATA